jgi:hypothetical protein
VGRRDKPADGRQLDSWLRSASDHIMAVSAPQELRRSGAKKPTYARRDDVLPSDDPLWVSLETEKEHFTLGERVQLRVRFVNAGAEQLYVPQSPIYYHSNLTPSDLRMESAAGQDLGAVGQPIVSMPPNGSLVRIARHGVYERVYTFPAGQRPGGGFPTNRPLLGEYHLTLRTFFSFPKDKNTLPNFTERYPFSVEELPENQELISKRMLVLPKIPIKIGTAAAGAED